MHTVTLNANILEVVEHPRGGIFCLILPNCISLVLSVNTDTFIKLNLNVIGSHTLFENYIPPIDSIYFSEDFFVDK